MYQLKGLRHSFATLDFYNNFKKYGSASLALEFTGKKRMKHSTTRITAGHYIQNYDRLDLNRFQGKTIAEILHKGVQSRLPEFI